jgi:hypothetical protein
LFARDLREHQLQPFGQLCHLRLLSTRLCR